MNIFKLKLEISKFKLILFLLLITLSGIYTKVLSLPSLDQISLSRPLTVLWKYSSTRLLNLTPAVTNERVYIPLTTGRLISLKASNGELLWSTELGGEISSSPVADEHGVYIATETSNSLNSRTDQATGAIRALGHETGVTLWMSTLHRPIRGAIAKSESTLFAGSIDGQLYAIRKRDGLTLWKYQHSSAFASQPTITGSRLYIGSEDGSLLVLDQTTGRRIWRYQTQGAIRGPVAVMDGTVCLGSADGYTYALEQATGRLLWKRRTGAGVQVVASAAGGVLVASLDNFAYFLSLHKGEQLWKRQLAGRIPSQPLITHDGVLLTPLSANACVVLDVRDGRQLNSLILGEDNTTPTTPVAVGNVLLVTTRNGLMAFTNSPQ
jgi:outer membrane protein assembly factor BamB